MKVRTPLEVAVGLSEDADDVTSAFFVYQGRGPLGSAALVGFVPLMLGYLFGLHVGPRPCLLSFRPDRVDVYVRRRTVLSPGWMLGKSGPRERPISEIYDGGGDPFVVLFGTKYWVSLGNIDELKRLAAA